MHKEDVGRAALLEILGETGARPVDEVIRALTYREIGVTPAKDLATVIARPDEFKDRLLAELALTPADVDARAEAAPDARHAYFLHTFALYLLGLWNEPRAFQPIVAYLAADPMAAEEQLDDIETEHLPAILARTYDGSDLGPLKALIENIAAPPFLRGACLRALHAMSRLGKLDRRDVVDYFEGLAGSLDHAANEDFMDVLASDMAALQEERLRPVIDRWFAEGLIDETLVSQADIDETYRAPYDEINEELTGREHFDALIDYLCEWSWFVASDPSELVPFYPTDFEDDELDDLPLEPYVREGRKIGRNEPCPCGSGKKYKKCCLDADNA